MDGKELYYSELEVIVGEALENIGYNVEYWSPGKPPHHLLEIDLVARNSNGSVVPVEIKKRVHVTLAQLRDDCSQMGRLQRFASKGRPLLVYVAEIEPSLRTWAEGEFQIDIWDRRNLLNSASPETQAALENYITNHEQHSYSQLPLATFDPQMKIAKTRKPELEPPLTPKGGLLKSKLKSIKPGSKGAKDYELICKEIINYLFGNDLRDVRSQMRTIDGLNIYDLIYRVRPTHRFWTTLTRDFRARVVLFECKNYSKPIRGKEVFITERYLSLSALRPICFVLTRKIAHPHATLIASGAIRETGKLLVFFSDIDVEKMLDAKDAQLKEGGSEQEMEDNDPTEILDQVLYNFIAGLPR